MTIEEAIKTAIEFEIKIRDLYSEAAGAVDDEVGKRIFTTLGDDEQHHVDYLNSKLEQLRNTGTITVERLESAIPSKKIIDQQAAQVKSLAVKDFHGIKQQMLSKALKAEIETSACRDPIDKQPEAPGRQDRDGAVGAHGCNECLGTGC